MANHPSAEKRNRQRTRRTARNRSIRSALRTTVKAARTAISTGDKAAAEKLVAFAESALAKAASKGILHDNTASRGTSRLFKALAKLA